MGLSGLELDPKTIGRRLRALREMAEIGSFDAGTTHHHLWRIEQGQRQGPTIGRVEQLCRRYGVSITRLFLPEEVFERMLVIDDEFVREVAPFLKQLNAEQKALVLTTLEAAPKIKPRRRFARIKRET